MRLVLRGAKRGCQALLQRPTEFQREQTYEDVPAGPTFLADEERAHFQQPGLQRAEVVFDERAVLIASLSRLRIEEGRGHVGLQDITTRKLHGLFLRCRIAVEREAAPVETQRDDTRELVALDPRLQMPQPGFGLATRGGCDLGIAGGYQGMQGVQFILKTMPCLTGFGGVLPQDVSPASDLHFRDLLRKLPQLDHTPLHEGADLRLGQRRDVPEALSR